MSNKRVSEHIVFICGFIPLVFMVSMLLYIGIARIKLGYWPTYGTPPDPTTFGLSFLEQLGFIGFLLFPISAIIGVTGLIYGFFAYGKKFLISKLSICCFLLGIVGFLLMRIYVPEILFWYLD